MSGPKVVINRPTKWGGAREGAGRPKSSLTERAVRKMLSAQRKAEKEHGATIDEVLLDIIYNKKTPPTARLTGIKLWKEHTQARPTEGRNKVDETIQGPTIYLPELDNDKKVETDE